MKNNFKDFISSIYNPHFYKNINTKSLRNIFTYMVQVCISVALVTAISTALFMVVNNVGPSLVVTFLFVFLATFMLILISTFLVWLIYGFILGILIMIISMIFKKKIPYTTSVKTALYAISLGAIFMGPFFIEATPFLAEVLIIVVVLINIKNVPSATVK